MHSVQEVEGLPTLEHGAACEELPTLMFSVANCLERLSRSWLPNMHEYTNKLAGVQDSSLLSSQDSLRTTWDKKTGSAFLAASIFIH